MDASIEWQSPCQANSNAQQRESTDCPPGLENGHPAGAVRHPASTERNAAPVTPAVTRPGCAADPCGTITIQGVTVECEGVRRGFACEPRGLTTRADVRLLLAAASALGHLPPLKRADHLAAGLRELAERLEAGQR
jgi:hypothetical protein